MPMEALKKDESPAMVREEQEARFDSLLSPSSDDEENVDEFFDCIGNDFVDDDE